MIYPGLSRAKTQEFAGELLADKEIDVDQEIEWLGSGERMDLVHLSQLYPESLEHQWTEFCEGNQASDRDLFEGIAAGQLHKTVRNLPTEVLDDPSFWRYLSIAHFWWLVRWRESGTFKGGDYSKYRKYLDASNPIECVLTRMLLRGQIALRDGDDYSLAATIPRGTDFWRSHILRVRTGTTPTLARAFVERQAENRLETTEIRAYAKQLNRVWTNVVLSRI